MNKHVARDTFWYFYIILICALTPEQECHSLTIVWWLGIVSLVDIWQVVAANFSQFHLCCQKTCLGDIETSGRKLWHSLMVTVAETGLAHKYLWKKASLPFIGQERNEATSACDSPVMLVSTYQAVVCVLLSTADSRRH